MSKKEKLIEKIKNNPKTVRFEEIDKILLDVGFVRTQPSKGSSHYTYHFENLTITIPYKRPYISESCRRRGHQLKSIYNLFIKQGT
ncbi:MULTISPECIES: hypothetical protein [Thermoanaerobacterium]|uniref:YcfA family protein n=2 Tax=Thermoanaerobacterium TaxID=28895 RepID=W9E8B9_9THEO|nr:MULTISPECIES: hypothetical protein [Thermoanaerobacterium]AFK87253.1 hypothetical protein Tsac_2249 [Thermoanaerobacterium saccharolyticum JW/SL-YS485]ETO38073.1 hypothetical protein V518_1785 [Thermoanaerobacterium aotearoense SCUT27]WHE07713.1 toxin HicA [Thermoanaerobacterium thermosaccharolyticum]